MAQLRKDYRKIKSRGSEVVVVGPEPESAFKQYWKENDFHFIGLPDPKHQVLKLFGQQVKIFKFGRMPAQVIIDKTGVVRFVHYGHNMADIPETQEILDILDILD